MKIDKKTYKLENRNYIKEVYNKRQVVIGHSGRKEMLHYDGWLYRHNGNYKKTSAYTIDRDGKIFQHYDPKYYSEFLGKEQDKSCIPITLTNEGWVQLDYVHGRYIDWLGNIYSKDENIVVKKWRNQMYWRQYTEEQLDSLKFLTNKLCEDFEIPKHVLNHNTFYEDVDLHDGVVYRSNYLDEVSDINPTFNISELKKIENDG